MSTKETSPVNLLDIVSLAYNGATPNTGVKCRDNNRYAIIIKVMTQWKKSVCM